MKKEDIKYIIVHCTATPEGRAMSAEEINKWHQTERGYKMIGYHYVIGLKGEIEQGRPEWMQGSHCRAGNMNKKSLGVCYVGGLTADGKVTKDTRTEEQKRAMRVLIDGLKRRYPGVKVLGHCDVNKGKACPCFNVQAEF